MMVSEVRAGTEHTDTGIVWRPPHAHTFTKSQQRMQQQRLLYNLIYTLRNSVWGRKNGACSMICSKGFYIKLRQKVSEAIISKPLLSILKYLNLSIF